MPVNAKGDYEFDHVYMPEGEQSFKNVRIVLKIDVDMIDLFIKSSEPIQKSDLTDILDGLEQVTFKKMKLNIKDDCNVFLFVKDKQYKVVFGVQSSQVAELMEVL